MSASNSLIPPSSANKAASLNVLVSLRHNLRMALRASGSTGTDIKPTEARNRASDCSLLSPEQTNLEPKMAFFENQDVQNKMIVNR